MANNTGTLVTSPIRPFSQDDTFPSAYSNELLGGYKTVATIVERDAIPSDRKTVGFLVYVTSENKIYKWNGSTYVLDKDLFGNASDITTALNNSSTAVNTANNAKTNADTALGIVQSSNLQGVYLGGWNATTNTPTLSTTPLNTLVDGSYYTVTVAGTQSITGTSVNFLVRDVVRKFGTTWVREPNVNRIDNAGDVSISNPIEGDVLAKDSDGLWKNIQPKIQKQYNPDISFAIVDAQQKMLAYFDTMGKMYSDFNLNQDSVTTDSIEDLTVTKQKLEQSLQDLLTLLANNKSFTFNPEFQQYVYSILDNTQKILFGIKEDGKFNFPTNEEFIFDPNFHEFVYRIEDKVGKILLGIRPDGSISTPINIPPNSIGLVELNQEVKNLIPTSEKTITFWGDSLTFGWGGNGTSTPSVMQDLKPDYTVINCGVGGETVASISARQGGMPCLVTAGFMIPANTSTVEISSNSNKRLKNILGTNVDPLLQGENGDSVNPCWIEGVECTLSWNGSSYFLQRNVTGAARYVKPNSPLFFKGSKVYRDSSIIVIEIGQNGGYSTTEEYLEYVESMIRYSRTSNFIVVGNHTGTPSSRAELETACLRKFGSRYINMREYISGNAIYDMNITPTQADLTAIQNGTFPPSFWLSPQDSVHGNSLFYTAKAHKINERFIELGY